MVILYGFTCLCVKQKQGLAVNIKLRQLQTWQSTPMANISLKLYWVSEKSFNE